jgi:hypothetical protein
MGARQELDPWHRGQVVIDDEQRHRLAGVGQLAQFRQPGAGGRVADDAEVLAEPPAEVRPERGGDPGIAIDDEDDWL